MKPHRRKSGPRRPWFSVLWGLFFAPNDRLLTWQMRRTWRLRASFFLLLGCLLTLAARWFLLHRGLCPR
jgi:hypothetical protein